MRAKKPIVRVSKPVLERMLRKLQRAEDLIQDVWESLEKLPKGTKNASMRRDKLIQAQNMISNQKFNLVRDCERSSWFNEQEHLGFLRAIEDELKLSTVARKQKQ